MANIARGQGDYPGKELTLQRIRSEQIRRQQESASKGKSSGPKLPKGIPSAAELKGKSNTQLAEMANIARGQGSYPGKELTLQRIRSEQIRRQPTVPPRSR